MRLFIKIHYAQCGSVTVGFPDSILPAKCQLCVAVLHFKSYHPFILETSTTIFCSPERTLMVSFFFSYKFSSSRLVLFPEKDLMIISTLLSADLLNNKTSMPPFLSPLNFLTKPFEGTGGQRRYDGLVDRRTDAVETRPHERQLPLDGPLRHHYLPQSVPSRSEDRHGGGHPAGKYRQARSRSTR